MLLPRFLFLLQAIEPWSEVQLPAIASLSHDTNNLLLLSMLFRSGHVAVRAVAWPRCSMTFARPRDLCVPAGFGS